MPIWRGIAIESGKASFDWASFGPYTVRMGFPSGSCGWMPTSSPSANR